MPITFQGNASAAQGRFAVVVSRFNESITSRLADGAVDTLKENGIADDAIDLVWVPGAFELPTVAARLVDAGPYEAVLCLGAVIRGQTSHYDYVCQQISRGVGQINTQTGVPTLFGVLTCETIEQAVERAGTKQGNAGAAAAMAAMEMADLLGQL